MGVPCWVDVTLNSSLMIWLDSNFARVFLNQDVGVSSPQPQPIDDIAGMRAAPWDDSPPRAVQVVSRHGALDLVPLLCRNRQERRCNPPFSDQNAQRYRQRGGVRFTPKRWYQQGDNRTTKTFSERNAQILRDARACLQPPASNHVGSGCFERSGTLRAGQLITAGSPWKSDSNRTHLS